MSGSAQRSVPATSVTSRPRSSLIPLSSTTPTRILGPWRSTRMARLWSSSLATARTSSNRATWSARSPWEKFSRTTSRPASTIPPRTSRLLEAGPRVATTLVRSVFIIVPAVWHDSRPAAKVGRWRGRVFLPAVDRQPGDRQRGLARMRFDDDSQLDSSQVRDTRGRGGFPRRGGVAIGGGAGILGVVVFILLQLLGGGGATSGALPGIDQIQGESTQLDEECKTGADANTKEDCRVVAVVNSLQEFWTAEFQRRGAQYQLAPTRLFSGGVQTGCGTASSDVGPFYCPRDGTVYIDLSFYRDLQTRFGAQGGAVRLELQADCYAGLWANHATTEPGPDGGDPLVERITEQDIADGLDAAAAIGDDAIQQRFQGQVNPETWTHGSSAQRQKWFTTGYRTGDPAQCNTFRGTV